jgi:hypothetical protein
MSANVQGAFHELIVNNDAVAALLTPAGKQPLLFANRAPHWQVQDEPDRYAVYWIVSTVRDQHLNGVNGLTMVRVQADSQGRTYDDAEELAEAIRLSCDGFCGNVEVGADSFEIRYMRLDNKTDGYVDSASGGRGWHAVSSDYVVWYRAGTPVHAG